MKVILISGSWPSRLAPEKSFRHCHKDKSTVTSWGGAGSDKTRGDDEDIDKKGGTEAYIVWFFFSYLIQILCFKDQTDVKQL